jgi:hypothetical protein
MSKCARLTGLAENGSRERNQSKISRLVLLGMFPWSEGTGVPVYKETLKLLTAFRPFKLENCRFHDAFSCFVAIGPTSNPSPPVTIGLLSMPR